MTTAVQWICSMMLALAAWPATAADFALHDGDTVVFLGDSLTAARTYSKLIEQYALLRFPARKIRFVNSGIGGDTAHKSLERLDRDVFAHKATVLVVMFGTNDIGWGLHADAEHKQQYLNAIRQIIARCQEQKVRVFVCSEPVTAEDPDKSETGFLKTMCDEALAISLELGERAIDVNGATREVQRRVIAVNTAQKLNKDKQTKLHVADGVHLSDLGQLAVAFAMLKGFDAPEEVSSATIDAATAAVVQCTGCRISDIAKTEGGVSFTRLDEGLPFNNGLFYALNYAFVPMHQLNGYTLAVQNVPAGRYTLAVDGRGVGTYAAAQLAKGVNIASATTSAWQPGGPWDAQATLVKSLTEARHDLQTAALLAAHTLPDHATSRSVLPEIEAANQRLEGLQRRAAAPQPYRFVLKPATDDAK